MHSRTRLFLSLLSLFVLIGCSDRGASGSRVLEARGQGSGSDLTARRLWHGPDVDVQGSVSPDGRLLSFSDWREGQDGSLSVRDLSTGEIRTLVKGTSTMNHFAFADGSVISPEGTHVAYIWEEDSSISLRVIPLAGGQPTVLYSNNPQTRYIQALAWSPDSGQLLVHINMMDRTNRLALIAYPSGTVRTLKSFDWRIPESATFSPDGRYVVYGLAPNLKSPQRDLYLLHTDGSREITVTSDAADERVLGWPRGSHALWFLRDGDGSPAVWSLTIVEGRIQGQPQLVKRDVWRTVAGLGFDTAGSMYYAISPTSRQVYTTTLDSSAAVLAAPTPVAEGTDTQTGADWSADGKMLAYASRRPGARHRIVIRTVQSGEVRELTPPMRYVQSVTWSPDGQSLFARGQDEEGRYGAYRIDARTGATLSAHRRPNLGGFISVTVAPDGSAIYYSGRIEEGKGEAAIIRRDLKTDQERTLHYFRGNGGAPSVSPDGRHLAFSLSEPAPGEPASIWIVGADGTNPRVVYRLPKGMSSSPYRGPIVWTKDGHLLFVTTGQGGTSLWRVPVAGGEATKIAVDLSSIRSFRLHPDGKRLAFDAGEPSYEVWLLQQSSVTSTAR